MYKELNTCEIIAQNHFISMLLLLKDNFNNKIYRKHYKK